MVMLRATRAFRYATRNLVAGDEFDANPHNVRILKATKRAEDIPLPDPPRRGRPPKVAAVPEAVVEPTFESDAVDDADDDDGDGLEEKSNSELRALAEERGLQLPPGYVRNDELIAVLRG